MTKPIRIQRKRTKGWKMPPNTVCVTRPGKWGNPFRAGAECQQLEPRELVLAFKRFIENNGGFYSPGEHHLGKPLVTVADIKRELRGKNLACWCALDQPCHADVLLEIANA